MIPQNMQKKVFSGMIWRLAERFSAQGVSFIVSIILARILAPNDYGIIAILLIFIDIANVFVVSGFGVALVQKKDADELDFSSVFYFNILFSLAIYCSLYFAAPFIARFYELDILKTMLRVMALKLPLAGINSVQQAYVQKNMMFKKFFFSTIIGTIISACVGIIMALRGFGAYALIAQYLSNSLCDTVILWFTVRWRPVLRFSVQRLVPLIAFGWKILIAALLNTFYMNMRSFVIGKIYTTSDLAYYNQGQKMPQMIVTNINASVDSVLLPAMSSAQDNTNQLKSMVRKSIRITSLLMWPIMIGIASVSHNLITVLLTEKWLPCIPFLYIACFQFALEPVQTANLQAIKAMGRSDLILQLEIIKKGYGLLILFLTMRHGVFAIALGGMTQTIVATICNTYPNRSLLQYSYREQLDDLWRPIVFSLFMGASVYVLNMIHFYNWVALVLQILFGMIIYGLLVYFFQREELIYVLKGLRKMGT